MPQDHKQTGYAVVKCTYTCTFTKTLRRRFILPGQATSTPVPLPEKVTGTDVWDCTFYAECRKNETHDKKLSEWYDKVVRQKAKERFERHIQNINQQSAEKVSHWERDQRAGQLSGNLQKGARPIPQEVKYHAFNEANLQHGKPYSAEIEPAKDAGNKIPWLPAKPIQ